MGTNGYIWIQPSEKPQLGQPISNEVRIKMSIVRNAIVTLEKAQIPIFKDTIVKVLE